MLRFTLVPSDIQTHTKRDVWHKRPIASTVPVHTSQSVYRYTPHTKFDNMCVPAPPGVFLPVGISFTTMA